MIHRKVINYLKMTPYNMTHQILIFPNSTYQLATYTQEITCNLPKNKTRHLYISFIKYLYIYI